MILSGNKIDREMKKREKHAYLRSPEGRSVRNKEDG